MLTIDNLPPCPVETTLMLMGDKWKVLIIRDLLTGTKRFGELKKSLNGISQKVLTQHLRAMEKSGLIHRKVYAEVPPKVEYTLTEVGQSLKQVHDAMLDWGQAYKSRKNQQ
ncbi:helix-turn-helix transcriptional regulator [Gilliamella sp. B3791]|uniref:winged helix-turn-helix transcriptional regulator n=1 Tax=unclassified Gilliamella TaxID=2685620 RepID=UPI002269AB22|nr:MULTISPECIES: helix-turn-helix domain-containing protein [unclassified Gilliamella]MCX8642657.1 helix-turn-helix transcriptional regulator [Gilliamella sp. B3835]MCX8708113.1 helix-turn-helix transcriptional regulator [Gilliamella sp. B3783]MCX8709665.1 helix-turn-helix transcriptional regulator [Gilliamella sp. B3780]MCX8713002.1 helix-turn-helix transcriptional regulator [Gilliamella sp. B3468]MCX8717308.1 helix-turn-helix transcriptional regulator [Gilliamella sp. B3784]